MDKATFAGVTDEQVENFCEYLGHVETPYIRVVGGEPLMHPNFANVILRMQETFINKKFLIVTNGILLTNDLVNMPNTEYLITEYPQNRLIRKQFSGKITVSKREYRDRDHDPNLSDNQAKTVHEKCGYRQFRMIGNNLYDCCHAETLERLGRSPQVHVKVAKDCSEELLSRNFWWECKHCFVGDL